MEETRNASAISALPLNIESQTVCLATARMTGAPQERKIHSENSRHFDQQEEYQIPESLAVNFAFILRLGQCPGMIAIYGDSTVKCNIIVHTRQRIVKYAPQWNMKYET
ncbi:hypothetical protein POTOM_011900 [Populus tomentosa]|uniref:Uncharacterized protein n=1 Tax=Populus tomentosa TaxID=118781 RepID=A0A8X8ADR6_POPTO|nr:hypothetical protein POTOM_011900 [Populus tomentosa]